MKPFHQRLAQLWEKACQGKKLSTMEVVEWVESLHAHRNWVSKLNELQNWADAAAVIGDHDWENRLCEQIDKLLH
ncbi:hypothetical protein H1164_15085 [Thermoactinomyces daqus]|uniref:Uncharacterized protein n=1 Tax=Thermoactinomyces daqus TaxID=1329516 RepID=A0A7W2AIW9_9BACL|nr:hypothetical protein [Thermoactinomyces daqus]MBA4544186.1 hypothetical protein [Thermoactinomyces daqus]